MIDKVCYLIYSLCVAIVLAGYYYLCRFLSNFLKHLVNTALEELPGIGLSLGLLLLLDQIVGVFKYPKRRSLYILLLYDLIKEA